MVVMNQFPKWRQGRTEGRARTRGSSVNESTWIPPDLPVDVTLESMFLALRRAAAAAGQERPFESTLHRRGRDVRLPT